jgi:flagellar biosynthesis component FlhA
MKKLTKKELKKLLNDKTKEDLVEEIWLLTKKYDFVKQHYEEQINYSEITKLLNKYKKMITELFSDTTLDNVSKVKNIFSLIDDYKKLVGQHESLTDLFLHTLNQQVSYTKKLDQISETAIKSLEKTLTDTVATMIKEQTYGKYKKEVLDIVEDLSNYISINSIISSMIPSAKNQQKK